MMHQNIMICLLKRIKIVLFAIFVRVEFTCKKIQNNQYEQVSRALCLMNQAIQKDPKNSEIYFILGKTQQNLSKHVKALNLYKQAIALNPNKSDYHIKQMIALRLLKFNQKALLSQFNDNDQDNRIQGNELKSIANLKLDDVPAFPNSILIFTKCNHEALEDIDQKLIMDPKNPEKYFYKNEYALELFNQATTFNPNEVRYYFQKANTLKSLKKFQEALDNYEKAAAYRENLSLIYSNIV